MCQKIVPRCCYCALPQPHSWVRCNDYLVAAIPGLELGKRSLLPNSEYCRYLSRIEVPVLYGCENNYSCISWFASTLVGFGDREDEKTYHLRQRAAEEYFALYKKHFAEKYTSQTRVIPQKKPQPFMVVARRAMMDSMESGWEDDDDDDDDDEMSYGLMLMVPTKRAPRTWGRTRLSSRNPRFAFPSNDSASSDGGEVPSLELSVSGPSDEESDEGSDYSMVKNRPRRMEHFRVARIPAVLTRGNPLITIYAQHAPRAPAFVTRPEIVSKPRGAASKAMARILDGDDAAKNASRLGRAFGMIQKFVSAGFGL